MFNFKILKIDTTITKPTNSASESPVTPCAGRMTRIHPIEYRYQPEVLCRYPESDYSEREKFPQYLHMVSQLTVS